MATYTNGASVTNGTNGTNGIDDTNGGNGAEVVGDKALSSSSSSSEDSGEKLASHAKPKPTVHKPRSLKPNRDGVKNAFEMYGQLISSKIQPLPTQGGGSGTAPRKWGKLSTDIKTLRGADFKTLKNMILAKVKGEKLQDDKTMIMERVIQLVANLPNDSKLRQELTNSFITELWESLDHPPLLYAGDKFVYRQADGSNNNVTMPSLGAAGTSYARSVSPTVIRSGALPDPNLIYDAVMKRTNFKPHPNKVSSILWYWAAIVIHDLFWTDYTDMTKSKTSSYLDMSPLYGSNQEMQDTIRTFKDGKLKPDCFADKRILGMPPGVGCILIFFNRFHNYVCDNLAKINEDGRFTAPSPQLEGEKAAAAWKKYDNDLFQTARLITSGLYINIMLTDYVRGIVNLNRVDTQWTLDPRQDSGIAVGTKEGSERGTGNVVSVEFNLCYRWHACISERDDKWIEDFYYELFGKPASDVTVPDLVHGFVKFERGIPEDPAQRPFNKYKRGPDGKFSDDDLAECITSAIEDVAGSFGGRHVPKSMRAVEILGIIQGRKWNTAGLNEFRKHFGLKPYEKFTDINSDPEIADSLFRLYGHPDFVELYPGLVAEEHKQPMVPGVGIAPTYTISRVVLSDAVCLVRGDRHYTTDYTARNLTNWGYNEVQQDLEVNHGCMFYRLFIRALPNHFKPNSVYAHYPMMTPPEMEKILKDLKRDHLFDFSRPTRIQPLKAAPTWHDSLQDLIHVGNSKFALSGDITHHDSHRLAAQQEAYTTEVHEHVKAFYKKTTERLLADASYNLAGRRFVDLVRDVGNVVPVEFASRVLNLPLKTDDNSKGVYKPHELYAVLAIIFVTIFQVPEADKAFQINQAARTVANQLGSLIEGNLKGSKGFFSSAAKKKEPVSAYGANLVKALSSAGKDAAWSQVLPTAVALVPTQGELFARAVDFYLSSRGNKHLPEIHSLASEPESEKTDALLLGYALEGARLSASNNAEDSVDPSRSPDSYSQFSTGPYTVLGPQITHVALTEMFRALFKHKNVARAPGPQGELKKVQKVDGSVAFMREDWGRYTPFPVTMVVTWDE